MRKPVTKAYAMQNRRIRRKTDRVILSILVWVYFLQVRRLGVACREQRQAASTSVHMTDMAATVQDSR